MAAGFRGLLELLGIWFTKPGAEAPPRLTLEARSVWSLEERHSWSIEESQENHCWSVEER